MKRMKVGRAIGCMAVKKMRPFRCHADLAGDQGDASYAGDWVTRSIRRRGEPAL
jgi:hypothetical protein